MKETQELFGRLSEWRPAPYASLPDLDLYKDQVLSYMQRQQLPGESADELTVAMINNYIKSGVLPRPAGKKYQRQHLAALTAICQLKQVLSVSDTSALLACQPDASDTEAFYGRYLEQLDEALRRAAETLPEAGKDSREALARCALTLAVQSYADRLAARELLALLEKAGRADTGAPEGERTAQGPKK